MTGEAIEAQEWPLRPWMLAGLLGLAGFLIFAISGDQGPDTRIGWKAALTALVFFGSLAFAFTLERERWREPLAFAALAGIVMAGLAWRAVGAGDAIADPQYGFLAGVVATALALPLFQADFQRARWATDYRGIHGHVWSDAICAMGSLAFVGASWLLLFLLAELFHLLKIDALKHLIDDPWFGWTWSGAAFGAALGVLSNELGIIGTLRRVVMTVLSLLAVPLAAGLALFLVAMVASGPGVLWEATRSATPVLLSCAAGAWVLANAILRDDDAAMSGSRILRVAALVLVLSVLPLTVFAAVSMGTRVAQHGLSPERLWGLVAIAVAVAYGVAWLMAVVRGWKGGVWRERIRRANLHLAVLICGVALFLALPIFDFGAISARQQVARLERGAVSAKDFDYSALRWDFGAAGRRALRTLTKSSNAAVAELANLAQKQDRRPGWFDASKAIRGAAEVNARLDFADPTLRAMATDYLRANTYPCDDFCVMLDLGPTKDGRQRFALVYRLQWESVTLPIAEAQAGKPVPEAAPSKSVSPSSKVEVRRTQERYIFVDGKRLEPAVDDE